MKARILRRVEHPQPAGSRESAAQLVQRCWQPPPVPRPSLLLYSGMLRDDHLMEPAQATLVLQSAKRAGCSFAPELAFDAGSWLAALEWAATFVSEQEGDALLVVVEAAAGREAAQAGALQLSPSRDEGLEAFGQIRVALEPGQANLRWDPRQSAYALELPPGPEPAVWRAAGVALKAQIAKLGLSPAEFSLRCPRALAAQLETPELEAPALEIVPCRAFTELEADGPRDPGGRHHPGGRPFTLFSDLDGSGCLGWALYRGALPEPLDV